MNGAGDLFVASGNQVLEITPAGTLSIVAGTGTAGAPTAGPATASMLSGPTGLAVNSAGDLFVSDTGNNVIEEVTPAGQLTIVAGNAAVAGTGVAGPPQTGPALDTNFNYPVGLAVNGAGDLFVADNLNGVIQQIKGL